MHDLVTNLGTKTGTFPKIFVLLFRFAHAKIFNIRQLQNISTKKPNCDGRQWIPIGIESQTGLLDVLSENLVLARYHAVLAIVTSRGIRTVIGLIM